MAAEPVPTNLHAAGDTIGPWRIASVLCMHDERYTLVEAETGEGKRLALKLLGSGASADDARRLGDLREAIEAPLLPVLGAGEHGGVAFVAHALPRGVLLSELLAEGPLDPATAMTLAGQMAGGLETAALLGLPCGVLTPQSVLVTSARPRQALVIDYGLSIPPRGSCVRAAVVEGADYCAPEIVRGGEPSDAGSVYALACILVECLTGAPPFPYDRPLVTLHAQVVEPPPRISERRSGTPAALDEVIATALNKRPEQRHASPTRFVRAAQKALGMKAATVPVANAARRHVEEQARRARAAAAKPRADAPAKAAPAKAARARAAQAKGAHAKARPRRADRSERRSGARRQARVLRPVPVVAVAMALLSTAAGFAAGHHGGAHRPSAAKAPAPPTTVAAEGADYLRDVDGVLERLSARRASARARLAAARRPAAQAADATALAGAYGAAREALPASGDVALAPRLRAAEDGYRGMAAAARRHDRRAFQAARRQVLRAEGDLVRAVDRLDQS